MGGGGCLIPWLGEGSSSSPLLSPPLPCPPLLCSFPPEDSSVEGSIQIWEVWFQGPQECACEASGVGATEGQGWGRGWGGAAPVSERRGRASWSA